MTKLSNDREGATEAAQDARAARLKERLARQQANQAEREARRSERRAARAAQKSDPSPVTARRAPEAEGDSPSFNILVVAQAGRLEREAALFAASLRHSAPGWRGRLIVAEPREEGAWAKVRTRISDPVRGVLEGLGAEITPFTAHHFGRSYPYGNKIEALSILPEGEPFIFFDSDTLITGPLQRLPIDFARPSASMRRKGTWPLPPLYGPGYDDIWRSLYDRFGLNFESSLDAEQPSEHWERYLYFNAGWFFGADPAEFGRRFLDYALAVLADPGEALACQSLDPWLDQVVLPLVVHGLQGGRPDVSLAGLDGDITCHYRNLPLLYARESDAALALAEELLSSPLLAPLFDGDEAVTRLLGQGEGRRIVRAHFQPPCDLPEQAIRQWLKRAGLWFR